MTSIFVPFELSGSTTILTRPPKLHENSLQLVIPLYSAKRRRKSGQKLKKEKRLTQNMPVAKSDKKE